MNKGDVGTVVVSVAQLAKEGYQRTFAQTVRFIEENDERLIQRYANNSFFGTPYAQSNFFRLLLLSLPH
jgi:hypothetical protein